MRNYLFVLLAFTFGLFSCTSDEQPDVVSIKIENLDFSDWDSLISIDSIVPLEQTDSSLLSVATTFKVGKTRMLFSDHKANNVYVFDRLGHFLFVAGGIGRSVSEHITVRDVGFSYDQTRIEILDERGIAIYNADDGKFIERKIMNDRMKNDYYSFLPLDDGYLLFTPHSDEYSVMRANGKNETEGIREKKSYGLAYKHFWGNADDALVLPDYGYYDIDGYADERLQTKYRLDFGEQNLPKSKIPLTSEEFDNVDAMKDYFKFISSAIETKDYLYVAAVGPAQTYYDIFYNKKTGKIYSGKRDYTLGVVVFDANREFFYGLVYLDYMDETSQFYSHFREYEAMNMKNPLLIKFHINDNL